MLSAVVIALVGVLILIANYSIPFQSPEDMAELNKQLGDTADDKQTSRTMSAESRKEMYERFQEAPPAMSEEEQGMMLNRMAN